MEFFKIRRDIPFMRHALTFNVISAITFVLAVAFLGIRGLHFSIEFTGGTVIEVSYNEAAGRFEFQLVLEPREADAQRRRPRVEDVHAGRADVPHLAVGVEQGDRDLAIARHASFPATVVARLGDDASGALTAWTGAGDREESLLEAYLSLSMALRAGRW